jgi:tetratricopeptide (TPR) repeat protein
VSDVTAAIARLEASLAREGASAERLFELGGLKLSRGDLPGAIAAYRQCCVLEPNSAPLFNNLGSALSKAGRHEEAIDALETAQRLDPSYLRPRVNLGKALFDAGRAADAVVCLRAVLRRQPDYLPALVNLGNALAASGDVEGAHAALIKAVARDSSCTEARMALAELQVRAGRLKEAIAELQEAVSRAPGHAEAHWHLGHLLFMAGHWEAAWPHMEYRLERIDLKPPPGIGRWDGTPRARQDVWLVGEQGLGDQLQFARYAPILAEAGVPCVLHCDARLTTLLAQADLAPRVEPLGKTHRAPSPRAAWMPLMSLPGWHRTTPDSVPRADGYLLADPVRVAHWHERLPKRPGGRIALAWAGNPRYEVGRNVGRSPPPRALAPLARFDDIAFLSLQKGAGEERVLADPAFHWITRLQGLDEGGDAFLDTAAVLECTDLLITSDTGIAHLAGALGVPTWLCLTKTPDWRWMLEGCRTSWYRSVRMFRQPTAGDWTSVYAQVAAELDRRRGAGAGAIAAS